MIKKILLAILIAIPFCSHAQKFGLVNSQEIIEALPETATMKTQLETASKKYEEEYSKLQEEFKKKYTDYQQLEETTPDAIKERRLQEMQELDNKIQEFRQTASQDLERQQTQLLAPIQEKIMTAIKAVGDEGGFTFIFENLLPVYSGTTVVDCTPLVKAKLDIK